MIATINNIADEKMDVSVILVNYNTRVLTIQCLQSIFEQTKDLAFEVLVVDNNSNDGTKQEIKKTFPQVQLIENSENIGFGRANNIGIQCAKGKYLFFLNTDTILLNNAVKLFFDFAEGHPLISLGGIGSVLLDEKMNPTHSSNSFPNKWEPIKSQFLGYFTKKYVSIEIRRELSRYTKEMSFIEVDYVTGADLFVLKSRIEEFEGFDPNFFMYFEESDLQYRMHAKGYRNLLIDGPQIIHYQGSSDSKPNYLPAKRAMNDKSMFYYFKKRSGMVSYTLFRLGYFLVKLPLLLDKRVPFADRLRYERSLLKK